MEELLIYRDFYLMAITQSHSAEDLAEYRKTLISIIEEIRKRRF